MWSQLAVFHWWTLLFLFHIQSRFETERVSHVILSSLCIYWYASKKISTRGVQHWPLFFYVLSSFSKFRSRKAKQTLCLAWRTAMLWLVMLRKGRCGAQIKICMHEGLPQIVPRHICKNRLLLGGEKCWRWHLHKSVCISYKVRRVWKIYVSFYLEFLVRIWLWPNIVQSISSCIGILWLL